MYDYAIVIGRFQPFHKGHQQLIQKASEIAKEVLIILGGHKQARTIKNPFSTEERILMMRLATNNFIPSENFIPIRDCLYSDNTWLQEVQKAIEELIGSHKSVCLVGLQKDESSYYLEMFPQWDYQEIEHLEEISAQNIREIYFANSRADLAFEAFQIYLENPVIQFLKQFLSTDSYQKLKEEYWFIQKYKEAWSKAPYPPTFVTTDAVVLCNGHVLVVRRRGQPGKGQIALPGGFIKDTELIEYAMLRELKEETKIKIPEKVLKGSIVQNKVFDHPERSLRGRTITHAYLLNLKTNEFPQVKGADDADKAWWMSLSEAYKQEECFFEDHYQIIQYFVSQV